MSERPLPQPTLPDPGRRDVRRPVPWRLVVGTLSELLGLALLTYVLWRAWEPAALLVPAALLLYLPNRRS